MEALEIPSLTQFKADPTYAEIVATCKRYDKAMEQQRAIFIVGKVHTVSEKAAVCGKMGYSAAHCWIKIKTRRRHT